MTSAQERLDQMRATSGQRWALVAVAVSTPALACLAIGAASRFNPTAVCVAVVALSIWTALRPDTHTDIFVMIIVVAFWLAQIDDVVTPWAIVVALALAGHHVAISVMASAPHGAIFAPTILRRWLRRCGIVATATIGVWALVVGLDRRHATGNATLSLAALVALIVAMMVIRARSLSK